MVGIIGIKEVVFTAKVSTLSRAVRRLNVTNIDTSNLNFEAPALSSYINCFGRLTNSIKSYQSLVYQDISTLKKVGSAYVSVDSYIRGIWKALN